MGHILLTKIKIINESKPFESFALAPVPVKPTYQIKRIGILDENCMAIELIENELKDVNGLVKYPKEFDVNS